MKEINVKARIDSLPQVISFVMDNLEEWGCSMKISMQVEIATEEIFVNIAHYAYEEGEGDAVVKIDFDEEARKFALIFIDRGIPFNPLEADTPDVNASLSERKVGGLGIFMTRKYMDDMQYEYRDGQNILTLIKSI